MAQPDTKTRILDAAQAEFSALGYDGASIRGIAQKASVQIASIRYHFGSKDDLWQAVFARHAHEVTKRRDVFYETLRSRGDIPTASEVAEAMLGPALDLRYRSKNGRSFAKLMANMMANPDKRSTKMTEKFFDPSVGDIVAHFKDALPGLESEEAYWGFFLAGGCLAMIAANGERLDRISDGNASADDQAQTFENMITFVVGGFEALAKKSEDRGAAKPKPEASRRHAEVEDD